MTDSEAINVALQLRSLLASRTNHTVANIIRDLTNGRIEAARNEYERDGDKIPRYETWGQAVHQTIYLSLGCRSHRAVRCRRFYEDSGEL
jgi:hypothetical protein